MTQAQEHHTRALVITDEPLAELIALLKRALTKGEVRCVVPYKPTQERARFEGERYLDERGAHVRHRSLRGWLELGVSLDASVEVVSRDLNTLTLALSPLHKRSEHTRSEQDSSTQNSSWHARALPSGDPEKYGVESDYARLRKLEDPVHLRDLERALSLARPQGVRRALSVGCHQGDELELLRQMISAQEQAQQAQQAQQALETLELIGVDHSESVIAWARELHPHPHLSFEVGDARALCEPNNSARYGELDLLMSLNLLQSPSLNGHELFKSWVKQLLKPNASVVVGLPNVRYQGAQPRFGAVTTHAGGHDLSQLITEAQFYLRYLRQQGFQTYVVGQYSLLIVGRRGR